METSLPGKEVKVGGEEARFNFPGAEHVYYPSEEGLMSHQERRYERVALREIPAATLPAVVEVRDGMKIAIAESDVEDYPGSGSTGTATAAWWRPSRPIRSRRSPITIAT
jgi:alpha-glucosidase